MECCCGDATRSRASQCRCHIGPLNQCAVASMAIIWRVWCGQYVVLSVSDVPRGPMLRRIPHTDVPSMVKQQKAALWAALKEFTSIHLVHAPPETFVKARREYEERM